MPKKKKEKKKNLHGVGARSGEKDGGVSLEDVLNREKKKYKNKSLFFFLKKRKKK